MTYLGEISAEDLYDAYTEIHESFGGAMMTLDELEKEVTDELSDFTTALDDIRDELERCSHMIRKLNRRMGPVLSYIMEQKNNEPLLFEANDPSSDESFNNISEGIIID